MFDEKTGSEMKITQHNTEESMDRQKGEQNNLVHAEEPDICAESTGEEDNYEEQIQLGRKYLEELEKLWLQEEQEQEALANERSAWLSAMPHYPLISAKNMFSVPRRKADPYLDGIIYGGTLTILAGEPKVGKSTFLLHALESMSRGAKFIDRSTTPCSVVYASEQPDVSLFNQIARIPGYKNSEHVHFIPFEFNNVDGIRTEKSDDGKIKTVKVKELPASWEEQIELWRKCLTAVKANVFVIDTFTAFAQLRAGETIDSGVVTTRLQQLKTLMSDNPGLAIVILHHLRKEDNFGGNTRDRNFSDIANSYAFRAATDTNVVIYNPSGDRRSPIRELKVESRFLEKPETLLVRLDSNRFKLFLEVEGFRRDNSEAQAKIASAIADNPELDGLANLKLAERLRVSPRQVENYRKNHPKSKQAG